MRVGHHELSAAATPTAGRLNQAEIWKIYFLLARCVGQLVTVVRRRNPVLESARVVWICASEFVIRNSSS